MKMFIRHIRRKRKNNITIYNVSWVTGRVCKILPQQFQRVFSKANGRMVVNICLWVVAMVTDRKEKEAVTAICVRALV